MKSGTWVVLLLGVLAVMLLGPCNFSHAPVVTSSVVQDAATPRPEVTPEEVEVSDDGEALPSMGDVSAEQLELLFDGYLKYNTFRVEIDRLTKIQIFRGGYVHAPGHHSVALAPLVLDQDKRPRAVLKRGDGRLSRVQRGVSAFKVGTVAGRLDKKGANAAAVAEAELKEEVGGTLVAGTFSPLGKTLNPTMPEESTECDRYFSAVVNLGGMPTGDGGFMEVVEFLGALPVKPSKALEMIDGGEVSDGARARTLFGRAFHSIGYLPEFEVYVEDFPELQERYDTLGLGPVKDIRTAPSQEIGSYKDVTIDGGIGTKKVNRVEVADDREMVDARAYNIMDTPEGEKTGETYDSEYLSTKYDRAKLAIYYRDPQIGPMVRLELQSKPILAFAPEEPNILRFDVEDIKINRDQPVEIKSMTLLGAPSSASSGQSDLYYHLYAQRVERIPTGEKGKFYPLAEALRFCRTGHGDVQTEALLLRLAEKLEWEPTLGMSYEEVRAYTEGAASKSKPAELMQ